MAAASLLALALSGCSGTPFGDQLSRSFSAPPASPASPAPSAAKKPAVETAPASPQASAPKPSVAEAPASRRAALPPAAPAPYRVTIKLPAADPSAPAEAVTEALRAAGVSFEVETIERVGSAAPTLLTPQRSPAPAPR